MFVIPAGMATLDERTCWYFTLNELSLILALARAGATGRAWNSFVAAGLENRTDDPPVLTLKGRLLKDQARLATGEAREQLFLQSARAYADASSLKPDSYALINAAAMLLFAGQADQAKILANQVLTLIQTGTGGGETAYWHAATRAEALLLVGETANAEVSLAKAVGHAPQAFEDHATTLRQFRLILECRGDETGWLDRHAPPCSLCYSGIIGIDSGDEAAHAAIARAVDDIAPAFGYGALAAGADIIIAEALLRRGAELHLVLPAIPSRFKEFSVEPFGGDWVRRFDAAFEAAASVDIGEPASPISRSSVIVAAQVSLGLAIDNAQRMESRTAVLRVSASNETHRDEQFPDGVNVTAIYVDRSANTDADILGDGEIAALLVIHNGNEETTTFADASTVDIDQGHVVATFARMRDATAALERCHADNPDQTIGLDYRVSDGALASHDAQRARAIRMLQAAAPGTVIMSTEAAMAFKHERPHSRLEPLGDLPSHEGPIALYAVRL